MGGKGEDGTSGLEMTYIDMREGTLVNGLSKVLKKRV